MATNNCPKCQKEISILAESCPHCGYKLRKHQSSSPRNIYRDKNDSFLNYLEWRYYKYWTGSLVAGILSAILGIISILISVLSSTETGADTSTELLISGIVFLIIGIIMIPVSIYKLYQFTDF